VKLSNTSPYYFIRITNSLRIYPAPGGESGRTVIFCTAGDPTAARCCADTHSCPSRVSPFLFRFRASGESKGSVSSWVTLKRGFDAAYDFLKTNRPNAIEQVAVFGPPWAGRWPFSPAAKYPELVCLLAENTFCRTKKSWPTGAGAGLRRRISRWCADAFLRAPQAKADPEPYSPLYNIGKVRLPAMFVSGDNDDLVALQEAEALFGLCRRRKADLDNSRRLPRQVRRGGRRGVQDQGFGVLQRVSPGARRRTAGAAAKIISGRPRDAARAVMHKSLHFPPA